MLATPSATPGTPPVGPEWAHEVKWDGIRLLARVSGGQLRLFNRTGGDVTVTYPELTRRVADLPPDLHVDGEVVALDDAGRPSFATLGHRMHVRDAARARQLAAQHPVTLMVFDVLRHDGTDLTDQPWWRRREVLDSLDLAERTGGVWQPSPAHDDGVALAHATAQQGLEGVVSKRRSSPYRPGARSSDWVKVPHRRELVAVIGGWSSQVDTPGNLGAVWVGHPADETTFGQDQTLYPIARVGSGLRLPERASLLTVLRDIGRDTCPFEPRPGHPDVRRVNWVDPLLCVQIRYLGGAVETGVLRQPVMRALRPDVTPLQAPTADLISLPG